MGERRGRLERRRGASLGLVVALAVGVGLAVGWFLQARSDLDVGAELPLPVAGGSAGGAQLPEPLPASTEPERLGALGGLNPELNRAQRAALQADPDRLRQPLVLTGQVRCHDGRLARDAVVAARWLETLSDPVLRAGEEPVLSGAFRLELSRAERPADEAIGHLELRVDAPGHDAATVWMELSSDERAVDVQVQLVAGRRFELRVLDESGQALVDARATAILESEAHCADVVVRPTEIRFAHGMWLDSGRPREPGGARARRWSAIEARARVHTDSEGRGSLGPFPVVPSQLLIEHDDYLPHRQPVFVEGVALSRGPLEVVMDAGATLRGCVVDAGGAAQAGVELQIKRQFESQLAARDIRAPSTRLTSTGADGHFEVRGLEPGPYELRVEVPGFERERQLVVLPRDDAVEIVLGARCSRRLRFAGELIPAVGETLRVRLRGHDAEGRRWSGLDELEVQAGGAEAGRPFVELRPLLDDLVRVDVFVPGCVPVMVDAPACGKPRSVELRAAPRISGRVLSLRGEPIHGAHVSLEVDIPKLGGLSSRNSFEMRTEADGSWSTPIELPARYELTVEHEGYGYISRLISINTLASRDLGSLSLAPLADLRVEVLETDGSPSVCRNIEVVFESPHEPLVDGDWTAEEALLQGRAGLTRANGVAMIEELPVGVAYVAVVSAAGPRRPYFPHALSAQERSRRVRAWAELKGDAVARVQIRADELAELQLVWHEPATLIGSTSLPAGAQASVRVAVYAYDLDGELSCRPFATTELDVDGRFDAGVMPRGPALVVLERDGLPPLATAEVVFANGVSTSVHLVARGEPLSLRVVDVDDAQPLESVSISLRPSAPAVDLLTAGGALTSAFRRCLLGEQNPSGETGPDGRLDLPYVPAAAYTVVAERNGYVSERRELSVAELESGELEVRMSRGATLSVTLPASQELISTLELQLIRRDDGSPAWSVRAEEGEVRFTSLPPGHYTLELSHQEHRQVRTVLKTAEVILVAGEEAAAVDFAARG